MHHVIADGEIAEVGEKRRHLRLLPLRTARAKLPTRRTGRARRTERGSLRAALRLRARMPSRWWSPPRPRRNTSTRRRNFIPRLGRATTNAKRQVVFVEDVGQPFDLARARHGEHHALAFARQPPDLFGHGGDRAVEARGRLGLQDDVFGVIRSSRCPAARPRLWRLLQTRAATARGKDTDLPAAPDCRSGCARAPR